MYSCWGKGYLMVLCFCFSLSALFLCFNESVVIRSFTEVTVQITKCRNTRGNSEFRNLPNSEAVTLIGPEDLVTSSGEKSNCNQLSIPPLPHLLP